jgi:hypothetical protein
MPSIPNKRVKREQDIKIRVIGKCWSYIEDNFHKFSEANKLKVSMELCKKSIPQENILDGQLRITQMPTIKLDNGQPFVPNIGEPVDSSGDPLLIS